MTKHESSRKTFLVLLSVVIGCLTCVSLAASYSVYKQSFDDWPAMAGLFAFLITVGVEIAFCILIFGMAKALIGGEMPVAGIGAAGLLAVMAINFVVHSNAVRGVMLSGWQQKWLDWVGLIVPFATIGLFILLSWLTPEAKERRQERRMAFLGKQRAMDFKEDYLNSPQLEAELENLRPMIADEVSRHITRSLPSPAPQTITAQIPRQIGFNAPPEDPKEKAKEMMRQRYFPNS